MRSKIYALATLAALVSASCATLKNVVHTVDDVAQLACELFGTEHPEEFRALVAQVAPAYVPKLPTLNVRDLCALREVIAPFLDAQTRLQAETVASVRAHE